MVMGMVSKKAGKVQVYVAESFIRDSIIVGWKTSQIDQMKNMLTINGAIILTTSREYDYRRMGIKTAVLYIFGQRYKKVGTGANHAAS